VTPLRTGAAVAAADGHDASTPIATDQQAVVDCAAPAVRGTAPAGSGKTRTMVEWAVSRARRLVGDGATDGRAVLAVSFTNRATAELLARVGAALRRAALPVDAVRVATFHGFSAAVLTEFGHHLGLARDPVLLGSAEQHALVERALDGVAFGAMDAAWLPTSVAAIAELSAQLADHQVSVETAEAWHHRQLEAFGAHVAEIEARRHKKDRDPCFTAAQVMAERLDLLRAVHAFRDRKLAEGALDHADQLAHAAALLDLPPVAETLRARHPFIVVDEYQDTNVAQRELLQRLHDPIGGQLVVVGDDAQSIYRFRGATLDNFRSFADHFDGAAALPLDHVYRHGPEVVAAAEAVLGRSRDWTARTTIPAGPASSTVELHAFADQGQEVAAIVEHVRALVEDEGVRCRDVAVLAPQRRVLVPIARGLEAVGIPVEAPGLGNLLDSPTFHEVLAVLRLAHDPGDAMAAVRVLRGPRYRLGPADLVSFVEAAEELAADERRAGGRAWRDDVGVRLLDGLLQTTRAVSPEVAARVDRFLDDLRRWTVAARVVPLADLVTLAADDLGISDALATSPSPQAVRARSELVATVDAAEEYETMRRGAGLAGFLAMVDRMLDEEEDVEVAPPDPLSPAVRLLTIHSAKGLEFSHVVVAGVVDQALPNTRATGCDVTKSGRAAVPDDLRRDRARRSPEPWDVAAVTAHVDDYRMEAADEQRRLFYVAVTRARRHVLLTRSTWVWAADGGPKKAAAKSSYFDELTAAGHTVQGHGLPAPAANPLAPLVRFDPPVRTPPSPLEEALTTGAGVERFASDEAEHAADDLARRLGAVRAVAAGLLEREAAERAVPPAPPTEHTVTDLVLAARCPVAYARRRVLGLPQAPSEAVRRGTLVHRWLEERAWALQEGVDPGLVPRPWQAAALLPLLPVDGRPVATAVDPDAGADAAVDDPPEPVGSDTEADRLADRFLRTPYAHRVPVAAELPLVLTIGGAFVRGTADLLFAGDTDDPDAWEVVDLKTGAPPADDAGWLQLEAYALAIADGGRPLDRAALTFLSLGGGRTTVVSRPARPRDVIVADLRAALAATRPPASCAGCRWCR